MVMPFDDDDEFEADRDMDILEEAKSIKADNSRMSRVRERIEQRQRELNELAERLDETDLPEAGVIKLGGLDSNGQ